ncbi:YeeE/YedE thiosulfate transporter family protein [Isachenkonia alkalipeptolytica]|uniref:YeeE/YedE family protein n=1 Tax=Isachenkonia alkalipeptolytica TaxID=2565777 RepID=A0AA43XIA6_9CLOT|nr:YeeE/YedE thiosulfate transporter family protein [Isachenkonia alkalipeptolytica]NBG87333.1 YeeE/YedE family protein [Isachenkonia alkalipeptolytica]
MSKFYEKVLKTPWPYWVAAIVLSFLNVLLLWTTGAPWRVTSGFLYWGIWVLNKVGYSDFPGSYVAYYGELTGGETFLLNTVSILNVAVIVGALLSVLISNEFKWRKIKNFKQIGFGIMGGLLMGYGARIAFGCNIGAFFSGIPSFSLHGWVFALFMGVGGVIGSKILMRYMI